MKRSKSVTVGLIGGVLVLLILALSSVWMGRNAKRETEEAVRSVSLLYLDERQDAGSRSWREIWSAEREIFKPRSAS